MLLVQVVLFVLLVLLIINFKIQIVLNVQVIRISVQNVRMTYVQIVFRDILFYLILHVHYVHQIVLVDVLRILNKILHFKLFVEFVKILTI